MQQTTGELRDLLRQQEEIAKRLRTEAEQIEALDFVSRNESLQHQLDREHTRLEALEKELEALRGENRALKDALVGHAYGQKLDQIQASWTRLQELSRQEYGSYLRELEKIERHYRDAISAIGRHLREGQPEGLRELDARLNECRNALNAFLLQQRQELEAAHGAAVRSLEGEVSFYRSEPLTEAQIKQQTARNNMEFRLGGRVANLLGVLLIVIGTVAGLQYTYTHLLTSNPLKSAAAYLLGILFLAGGEVLGKKMRSAFSLAITAGGIAILFASTAISHFVLGVLSVYAAFGMCVLIAALALLLSLRHGSQTIANFALIGGFLPITAVSFGLRAVLFSLMGYLALLNFFTLLISNRRDWRSVKYISLFFNTLSSLFIVTVGRGGAPLNLAYVTVNFAIYVFIAILHPLRHGKRMDTGSFVVVVLNSLINCCFVFGILTSGRLDRWLGLTALVLAAFYYGFSYYLGKRLADGRLLSLFLATSLVFAVLVVPLQFDSDWIAMGWLLESAVLIAAGMLAKEVWYRRIGRITYALCLLAFLLFDLPYSHTGFFLMKFTAVVLTSVFLLAAGLYVNRETEGYLYLDAGQALRRFKHYVMVLLYVYLVYLASHLLRLADRRYEVWELLVLALIVTTGYAYFLARQTKLRDRVTDLAAIVLFGGGALTALLLNLEYHGWLRTVLPLPLDFVALNLCGAFCAGSLVRTLVRRGRVNPQVQPLVLFSYLLVALLQMLMVQGRVAFNDMLLSFVLILAALLYVVHGFRFRTPYTRRVGLGLSVATVVKFFIVDLSFLRTGQKILSYFVLGLMLIGISFVYQHFSKRVLSLEGVGLDPAPPAETKARPTAAPPKEQAGPTEAPAGQEDSNEQADD